MKKVFVMLVLGTLLFCSMVSRVDALYCANDVVSAFPGEDKGMIESYVIEGASLFFKGKATAMNLFAEGESGAKNPFDFSAALSFTTTAIDHLQKARINFSGAFDLGKAAGYVKSELDVLKKFDYEAFAAENELNGPIMDRVEAYLSKGDITGFYKQMVTDIDDIIAILSSIKTDLEKNIIPKETVFWKLLQKFSETTLFGNYGTMVGVTAFNLNK